MHQTALAGSFDAAVKGFKARPARTIPRELWVVYLLELRAWSNATLDGYEPDDPNTGVVYFIQAEDGPVKIGYTSKPVKKRLGALQSHNAKRLTLLGTTPGSRQLERMLHRQFKDGRIHGEWFKPNTRGLRNVIKWANA